MVTNHLYWLISLRFIIGRAFNPTLVFYFVFQFQEPERDDSFQLELSDTTGGAEIGRLARTIVTIVNDDGG